MAVNEAESLRAFIAVELCDYVRQELKELENLLKKLTNIPAKWVPPENMHLTIIFLGQVPGIKIRLVERALAETGGKFDSFHLGLSKLGAFPNMTRPRTLWVGLDGDVAKLLLLHKSLSEKIESLGFKLENRHFSPHLTLARIRGEATESDIRVLPKAVSQIKVTPINFEVKGLSLIESRLLAGGPVYSALYQREFG